MSGKTGLLTRYILLKNLCKSCGNNVSIHQNVFIYGFENLSFGNNVSIHPMNYIDANGEIIIGNNVSIAHSSTLISTNHSYNDITVPIKYNPITYAPIFIHDDVWIGCGCRILSGVKIYSRSIIAAGAVVNKDVQAKSIYGGVPAKYIKGI